MASRLSDRVQASVPSLPQLPPRPRRSVAAAALLAAATAILTILAADWAAAQIAPVQVGAQGNGPGGDVVSGKENNQNVFVRDSAIAQEKFENAKRMERQRQWNNAASFYQEVLEKYAGRVVPSAKDKNDVIIQYTSIANGVRDHLCHWPQEGLDVYRAMNEPKAAALLEAAQKAAAAGQDDSFALHEVLRLYFVTDAGKAAAMRLMDEKMERGEFAGVAWLGDELLNLHPNLVVERPAVLFRTALAYHLAGNAPLAAERARTLSEKFPNETGVVRGTDAVLAKALEQEMAQSPVAAAGVSADSWPMVGGNPQRDLVPAAHASPGTRLAGVPLARPDYKNLPEQQKHMLLQQYQAAGEGGMTLGVLPVADRGELFFQDGMRIYAVSLESGVPLPGWVRTHGAERQGEYVLPNVWGSTRSLQQTLTLTDRRALAVMGQPDHLGMMQFGMQLQGEARLVCLDRETGKELWVAAPSTMNNVPKNDDEKAIRALQLSGSPLVVGDNVLVIGRANKPGQGEDCYVLAFDLSNGHYRWGCYIASSGMTQNMMWPMAQVNTTDNTSHLAYANGRVYVLTNLGAVAALDAYSGTIVWLDIYPTDRPAMNPMMMRGGWPGPMIASGSMGNASRLKPWMYNPVVVHEGKLFVLPTEGSNLLIYDAGSGKEEKRINLDQLSRWHLMPNEQPDKPTTLVGIQGDKLVLAGESRVLCLDWRKYDEEKFPGPDDEMFFWYNYTPDRIRGRCFMTSDSVFVPGGERMRRLDMNRQGMAVEEYPRYPRTWEDGESPGNVLVNGDHVVVAGATSVDIYTDVVVATAKLDREIAAAPRDPEPRLRFAEVLFVAGRADDALSRLDEAVKLMGGADALAAAGPSADRDRLFNDALTFANKSLTDQRPETLERATRFFDRAAKAAFSAQQQVNYRMARARFAAAGGDAAAAVKLYQEILADAQMRVVPVPDEKEEKTIQADGAAEKAIDSLIRSHGPEVYAAYQEKARKEMEEAQADKDHPDRMAEKLLAIAQGYPNSGVAAQAMLAAADAYEHASQPHQAIRVLRQMWFKYAQQGSNRIQIAEAMARNYLAVTDRNRPDMVSIAAARLATAAQLPGDPKLSHDMKLPDGKVLPAGTTFAKALEEVRAIHGKEAAQTLPDFRLPQPPTVAQKAEGAKYPKPFVGQTKAGQVPASAATVLPGVSVLVPPERDFARSDRVVAWGSGTVSIFPAGQAKPSATTKAFPSAGHGDADAPRGVAWAGDSALVWGGNRLVCIDGNTGKITWDMDLGQLGTLEVVRTNDGPGIVAPNVAMNGINNAVLIQRNIIRQRMIINANAQVVVQGGIGGVAPAAPAAPANGPAAPAAGGGEQVAEVRPVGDRVLVSTSTGRLLSAELSNGRVAWQTRLSEHAPDRLVATEDFTVAKVSDEVSCHLFALDTYSGSVRGSRAFSLQNNQGGFPMVPVNLALSPDGILVYTLPDQMRLKDLYKGWDEEEKVVPGPPGQPLYAGAKLPGQLVISEGRILAVADNAPASTVPNQKWVRVHSLETGQPLSLKYTAADGTHKEVDRILTAESRDWNVMLRVVGPHLYVIGPNSVFGYNLDKPSETWKGSQVTANNGLQPDVNYKDAFVGQQHLVLLDLPPSAPAANGNPTQYRLLAFARRPSRENDPTSGESGRLDYPETITDPAGITPTWQACDGGFYYGTTDGKVHMLLGAKQK